MLFKWFLLIVLFFACAKSFAQNSDALRLNVRLYPAQIFSINNDEEDSGATTSRLPEFKSVTVSSPSGFEVKVHHETFNEDSANLKNNDNCYKEHNLIDRQKGVIQKVYKIHEKLEAVLKKSGCDSGFKADHVVLTLISQ
ncbi:MULTISPECIES: hypothetical protein [Chryseobacterium]|uniref:hypothetical protein n=1 Tax=Chryseobacterium TaxID=59732 RepID=UPI0015566EDE|nr:MULTISPECIES: hypothetical protein [unclassified Chryseobacterium]MDC8104751.1 hypothetical protein [Chryseobacterium sp. B21-037]MDQ1806285.1 hypothetical protein [Chryseobacterium sp. CKR4-1]WBV58250.1 hypothetical protein PFY10_07300 [Chryseobacterium daecheongense]